MARLKELYVNEVAPALMKKFAYKSVMQIPKLDKIVINVGCGEARDNPKVLDAVVADVSAITGQKPVLCKAKKSVANFKLREGMVIGVKVTLRGERMYEFLDRFFNLALPRVRDFRGINPNSFDGRGNYSMGIREQLIFPEIDYDKIDKVRGMDICFVTTANILFPDMEDDMSFEDFFSLIGVDDYEYFGEDTLAAGWLRFMYQDMEVMVNTNEITPRGGWDFTGEEIVKRDAPVSIADPEILNTNSDLAGAVMFDKTVS